MATSKKGRVVLDLDSTLIYAEPTEDFDMDKHKEKYLKFKSYDMDGFYIVFERPGLQEFLDFLFKNFNVSVWTAASKDYALFIIKNIVCKEKDRKLDHIFFSYHCDVSSAKKTGTKDLSTLWDIFNLPEYNNKNTVIIDDYDEVHQTQPGLCIISVPEFKFSTNGSEEDQYFSELKPHMEKLAKTIESDSPIDDVVKDINRNMNDLYKRSK